MSQATLYMLSGAAIMAAGLHGLLAFTHLVRKVLAVNVAGSGLFLVLIGLSRRGPEADPVPHAMVLTGIVVAVGATAFGLALTRRLYDETGRASLPEEAAEEDEIQE